MDWIGSKERVNAFVAKYKYFGLILILGIILMCIPTGPKESISDMEDKGQAKEAEALSVQLEKILEQMEGVGKTRVLLTEKESEEVRFQVNEDYRGDGSGSKDTVIISDAGRVENGLITSVIPPVYRGAIVVCQGADSPEVRLAVIRAVSGVTGISSDRITVVKMK